MCIKYLIATTPFIDKESLLSNFEYLQENESILAHCFTMEQGENVAYIGVAIKDERETSFLEDASVSHFVSGEIDFSCSISILDAKQDLPDVARVAISVLYDKLEAKGLIKKEEPKEYYTPDFLQD